MYSVLLSTEYLSTQQLLSHSLVSDSLRPRGLPHARLLYAPVSWSLLKSMSIEPVILPNRLILCHPLLLLPLIFSSIRVFSSESTLCIRWSKNKATWTTWSY